LRNVGIQKVKGAEALLHVMKAYGGVVVYLHSFLTSEVGATTGASGQIEAPDRNTPLGKIPRYPLTRRLRRRGGCGVVLNKLEMINFLRLPGIELRFFGCQARGVVTTLTKGKVRYGGVERKQKYSSSLPLTSALDGRGGLSTPRPGRFTSGKDTVSIVQEAGWISEPVWTGAKNLSPPGIRSPDRPASGELLYRLSYPSTLPPDIESVIHKTNKINIM
jgi:hypothetical protein